MNLTVQSAVLDRLGLSPEQWLMDLALGLFIDRHVTLGQAAEISGLSQTAFLRELGSHGIPIHYDQEDFLDDMATLERRGIP